MSVETSVIFAKIGCGNDFLYTKSWYRQKALYVDVAAIAISAVTSKAQGTAFVY